MGLSTMCALPGIMYPSAFTTRQSISGLRKKGPLSGDFDQYSFQFLRDFIHAGRWTKIPSVEEVLRVVTDSYKPQIRMA